MIRMAFRRLAPCVLSAAVMLALAATASAQTGVVRGKVVDAQGAPVDGAKVTISAKSVKNTREVKTNKKGEFVQVGLFPDEYTITAEKDKLKATQETKVSIGDNPPLEFKLAPAAGDNAEMAAKQAALQKVFQDGVDLSKSGKYDESIAKFNEAIAQLPNCPDCYYNIGYASTQKKDWEGAEAAYKKAIELKADHCAAWAGLANAYNASNKTDLALEATAKSSSCGGTAAAGGGLDASGLYNQGVILWNAAGKETDEAARTKKFTEAKEKFDAATKADPKFGQAWYLLGKANINLGDFAGAVAAYEGYLQNAPTGEHADEVKKDIDQLKPLVKQ
jgi:tetratricopeptide (TPR) repeat protein